MRDTTGGLQRARVRADLDRERARAEARAELLPFGDGYLDDDRPDFHGTNVGLQRHADAGEPFCPPCSALLDELLVAGLARRVEDPATGRGTGRARHGRAESGSSPAPYTPDGSHQEQGRAT
jgi:hypothetical protein